MLSVKTYIQLSSNTNIPVYQQIANAVINAVQQGFLKPGSKLPSTRAMAEDLGIHRKTVVAAMEELNTQGWIETVPSKGTFISSGLPDITYKAIKKVKIATAIPAQTAYPVQQNKSLERPLMINQKVLTINDGFPDHRMAPAEEIGKYYRNIIGRSVSQSILSYAPVEGNDMLRHALADYLNETRGLSVSANNILITRGSQMGIYLLAKVLLTPGDRVVVTAPNYFVADMAFREAGALLLTVPVDEQGIDTATLEKLCRKQTIRAVFITPYHHYPTTVTLSAERRIHLLQLARQYKFAILEDDYDYDFHYAGNPLLPLISIDKDGYCIYIGSFSKTIAPAIRIGYVVAPENLVRELSKLRRIIDRQGDPILEQVLAELLKNGVIRRNLHKARKVYQQRRDDFCTLLQTHLEKYLQFDSPGGGMAVWARFDTAINFDRLQPLLYQQGIAINHPATYASANGHTNAIRMGFASMNEQEMNTGIQNIEECIKKNKLWK